jgi:N-(2-amino-2-carboxyethyl)-L-glutamate synthase
VQALFVGVSTGGTLAGVSRAARAARPDLKVVGVDVEGSRAFGGPPGVRILTGIGSGIPSRYLEAGTCDAVQLVSSWAGARQCREWREATGLGLGGSSGAVLAAALHHLADHPELDHVLCLCPDLGENYVETIYDDAWALEQGLASPDAARPRFDVLSDVPEPAA